MRLIVDTSVIVGEVLRRTGQQRLADPRLELVIPEQMMHEVQIELPRRAGQLARHRGFDAVESTAIADQCIVAVQHSLEIVLAEIYDGLEEEARWRCARDPADWPVVATALVLGAAIWTNDNDFLGTGVATWTTGTLQAWLEHQPAA